MLSDLTEETLQLLPMERVREGGALLVPGAQCRVCLRGFKAGQYAVSYTHLTLPTSGRV